MSGEYRTKKRRSRQSDNNAPPGQQPGLASRHYKMESEEIPSHDETLSHGSAPDEQKVFLKQEDHVVDWQMDPGQEELDRQQQQRPRKRTREFRPDQQYDDEDQYVPAPKAKGSKRKQRQGGARDSYPVANGGRPSLDKRSNHSSLRSGNSRNLKGSRSMRNGGSEDQNSNERMIYQTHMQHVLNLEAKSEVKPRLRESAAPDLQESPLQKEFIYSLEEFERKLIIVTVLSLVVVAIGILGTFLCKSAQLQHISFVALALNMNWLAGFAISNKVKKELLRVQYTNLNGQTGFEILIYYSQLQILLLICIYLYMLILVRDILIEIKEMDLLADKDGGRLWEEQYDQMPLQSVQAILISFSVVQALMMIAILGYLFRFAQNGIQWSNKQVQSRSRGFFLVIGCIILPLYDMYLAYSTRQMRMYVKNVPELEANLMPNYLMWIIFSLTLQTAIMSIVGFFAISCTNKFMTTNFIYFKIVQFVLLVGVFLFMVVNLIRFERLSGYGVSTYLDDNWPRILKFIHMEEFDSGLIACQGGKYLQNTQISAVLDEVECPVWADYDGLTKRDFIALLWELKDEGMLNTDDAIYGCLNSECASSLKSGLVANQMIMMFVILGLAFLNMFAIGLAMHTMKFDIHYKSTVSNFVIFLTLMGIISGGIFLTATGSFHQLEVSPESLWSKHEKFDLPPFKKPVIFSESEWYPLLWKLEVAESCEGIPDPEENCNALDYNVQIQATSGNLRLNKLDTGSDKQGTDAQIKGQESKLLTVKGSMEEVNKLLAGVEFSPACDDSTIGAISLSIKASAIGPQAKTQTFAQLLPEGQPVKVSGTLESQLYFAYVQMNAFDKTQELSVQGRVVDLSNQVISNPETPMHVTLTQSYGAGCAREIQVPVSGGYFEANLWLMSDERSFKTKVKLNSGQEYLKIEQHLEYGAFIDQKELFLQIQTVKSSDRMLAGVYRFKAVSATDYSPITSLQGEYSISAKETGVWTSDKNGEVYLEHLKVGLTNVLIHDDPDYFNMVINGAKVLKGEETRENDQFGRSAILVPRSLDKEILFTLSWLNKDFQLNLMAETFIDSDEGVKNGENCVLSFGQPKCKGIEHLAARHRNVLGETIKMNSNLFYDQDKKLIPDKRVMIYVMDTAENRDKEISASSAMIGISLPDVGQIAQIGVPFKTKEEEERDDLKGIIPFNWAAMCISVQKNETTGQDQLHLHRLNGLSVFRPNPAQLCGDEAIGGLK